MESVREFVARSYRLISASSPNVPQGQSDFVDGLAILNQLLKSFAGNGLNITIARTETCQIIAFQQEVVIGDPTILPLPDISVGRLANYDSAWIILNNVTYPLIDMNRNEFLAAFKYEPLNGLPRFAVQYPEVDVVRIRLYPAPSQRYQFYIRGKFELPLLNKDSNMSLVPVYYQRFLWLALARDLAAFKGRIEAWTPNLERLYKEALDDIQSNSEVNLTIAGERASMLNGRWRLQAGV